MSSLNLGSENLKGIQVLKFLKGIVDPRDNWRFCHIE
jgi:hypothetical protein